MNNKKIEILKPLIFSKKVNLNHKIIPLNAITNTIGPIRFFPPATKEWFNSIYAYNQNSIKNLSIADKTLSRLIRSYFNLYFSKKILDTKRKPMRFVRLSLNKVFISKAELKHTSSKVIVTLYVYNEEKRFLIKKIKELGKHYFKPKALKGRALKKLGLFFKDILKKAQKIKSKTPLEGLLGELNSTESALELEPLANSNPLDVKSNDFPLSQVSSELKKLNRIISLEKKAALEKLDPFYSELIIKTLLEKEIKELDSYMLLLELNKMKFDEAFLGRLKYLVGKIYNKEVEFNIVDLKTLYFNSDIFTQAISMKLKVRKNNLLRVLKSSLHLVKLPAVGGRKEKYRKGAKLCLDHFKNLHINSAISKYNINNDILDDLLLDILPSFTKRSLPCRAEHDKNKSNPIDLVVNSLKYKTMAGARLEAKGRLTRRFTASRSVFKVKWKGSIKNLDSSYKSLSTVVLRGHAKSNVQHTTLNSKTRNGAFGLKGWVSSK